MTQKDIPNCFLPVTQLSEKLEKGGLSSLELIEEYLERIRKHDRNLGAFIDVYEEEARKAAAASDMARASGHIIGPLQGIPVAVKDIIDIEGKITTGGSMVWKDRRSTMTATLVRRMVEAGICLLYTSPSPRDVEESRMPSSA